MDPYSSGRSRGPRFCHSTISCISLVVFILVVENVAFLGSPLTSWVGGRSKCQCSTPLEMNDWFTGKHHRPQTPPFFGLKMEEFSGPGVFFVVNLASWVGRGFSMLFSTFPQKKHVPIEKQEGGSSQLQESQTWRIPNVSSLKFCHSTFFLGDMDW